MGLKTENYVSKMTGHLYATAYAKIRSFVLNSDDSIRVTFGIHTSREYLDNVKLLPMETITLDSKCIGYEVNRDNPWQAEAYNMAKTQRREVESIDAETKKPVTVVEYGELYGWEDDYTR